MQWNDLHVRLMSPKTGLLLREHLRTRRGWYQIHDDDRPARTPPTTLALLARATAAGPHIGTVCTQIQQHDGVPGIRRIQGVLALAKKHGVAVVEDAATAALEIGMPTYRFVRMHVDRRPSVPLTLRQVDPLIRQLTIYRDLIDRKLMVFFLERTMDRCHPAQLLPYVVTSYFGGQASARRVDNQKAMKGAATRRILDLISELEAEGLL